MVFLFQRVFPHYRAPVFEQINSMLDNRLVLCCGQPVHGSFLQDLSAENLSFKIVHIKNYWFRGETAVWANFLKPFKVYGCPDAVIVEQSPRILFLYPLYVYCKIRNIPFILWGHGGSRRRSVADSNSTKDRIHRSLIKQADAFLAYSDGIKTELSKATNTEKIFVARNTLDTKALCELHAVLEKEGRETVKKRLGLKRQYYICFISRLMQDKQVDYLIDVFLAIRKQRSDVGLLIIGNGPEKINLEQYANKNNCKSIHFLGAKNEWDESAPYLFASDVMVIPGCVGLSVNHVFCLGVPVITQETSENGPFHGPEVEYIVNGETGFICKNGDQNLMADRVIECFEKRTFFQKKTLQYCESELSIETMVAGIKAGINFVKAGGENA